jgi:hypothetical protein
VTMRVVPLLDSSHDVPVLALLVVVQLVLDHANHDLVRHKLALVHDLLGLATKLGLSSNLRAKHVAGGQVAGAVLVLDPRGLSTLAFGDIVSLIAAIEMSRQFTYRRQEDR